MNRLRLLILGVDVIFVTVVAPSAHARCHVGNVAAIPVAIDNNQLLAQGTIDGRPVRALIDTGSNMSLIWRSAAQRLGLRLIGAPRKRLFGRDSVEFDVRHGVVRTMETTGCTPAELPYWAKTYSMADLVASPRDAQAIAVTSHLGRQRDPQDGVYLRGRPRVPERQLVALR